MSYLLIFDMRGNGSPRKHLTRYLRKTARKRQNSVWEFSSLSELDEAAKLVRRGGGSSLAFSRSDEILLCGADFRKTLRRLTR